MPFREAHHITGRVVKRAEELAAPLWDLPITELQAVDARITPDVFSVLSLDASVRSRTSHGGTAPHCVRKRVDAARKLLDQTS